MNNATRRRFLRTLAFAVVSTLASPLLAQDAPLKTDQRAPTPEERAACVESLAEFTKLNSAHARTLVLQALMNHNDFVTLRREAGGSHSEFDGVACAGKISPENIQHEQDPRSESLQWIRQQDNDARRVRRPDALRRCALADAPGERDEASALQFSQRRAQRVAADLKLAAQLALRRQALLPVPGPQVGAERSHRLGDE